MAVRPDGDAFDPFEVVDRLRRDYPLIYLVDLDGIERSDPQLDYIQEFSRDVALWVDGGVRRADQSIDVIVAGARRAVLSSGLVGGPRELRRAWKLTPELVFEIDLRQGVLQASPEWETTDPIVLARAVHEVGVDHFVVSPRDGDPDWSMVRSLAAVASTWVDGSFLPQDTPRLKETGASGGIFHIDAILDEGRPLPSIPPAARRDDEDQNQLTRDE